MNGKNLLDSQFISDRVVNKSKIAIKSVLVGWRAGTKEPIDIINEIIGEKPLDARCPLWVAQKPASVPEEASRGGCDM